MDIDIKRIGSRPSQKGHQDWFTGTVRIDPLFQAPDPARASGAQVTFEPTIPPIDEQLGAASLGHHVPEFGLHAIPDSTKVDVENAFEFVIAGLQHVYAVAVDARIVVGGVQPAERGDRPLDHGRDLRFVGHVASDGESLVAGGDQSIHSLADGILVDVSKCDCGTRLSKSPRRR